MSASWLSPIQNDQFIAPFRHKLNRVLASCSWSIQSDQYIVQLKHKCDRISASWLSPLQSDQRAEGQVLVFGCAPTDIRVGCFNSFGTAPWHRGATVTKCFARWRKRSKRQCYMCGWIQQLKHHALAAQHHHESVSARRRKPIDRKIDRNWRRMNQDVTKDWPTFTIFCN